VSVALRRDDRGSILRLPAVAGCAHIRPLFPDEELTATGTDATAMRWRPTRINISMCR